MKYLLTVFKLLLAAASVVLFFHRNSLFGEFSKAGTVTADAVTTCS